MTSLQNFSTENGYLSAGINYLSILGTNLKFNSFFSSFNIYNKVILK